MPISISLTGDKELEVLKNKMMRWATVAPAEVKKALKVGAEMVRREAQEKHFRKPKMPRGEGGIDDAWLGTTGAWRLRNSIALSVTADPGKISATVGTNVPYARQHEFGIGRMPERPFLRPSLRKKHQEVFNYLREAFLKSYGK
jgi:HK97 gp10 family phage protein